MLVPRELGVKHGKLALRQGFAWPTGWEVHAQGWLHIARNEVDMFYHRGNTDMHAAAEVVWMVDTRVVRGTRGDCRNDASRLGAGSRACCL
jgi:hypothetical protein